MVVHKYHMRNSNPSSPVIERPLGKGVRALNKTGKAFSQVRRTRDPRTPEEWRREDTGEILMPDGTESDLNFGI